MFRNIYVYKQMCSNPVNMWRLIFYGSTCWTCVMSRRSCLEFLCLLGLGKLSILVGRGTLFWELAVLSVTWFSCKSIFEESWVRSWSLPLHLIVILVGKIITNLMCRYGSTRNNTCVSRTPHSTTRNYGGETIVLTRSVTGILPGTGLTDGTNTLRKRICSMRASKL